MSDQALESQGVKVQLGNGDSPETFTDIPEVKTFNFRSGSASVIDTSDLLSTSKAKRMGLPDEGQLTFTLNWRPKNAVHAELAAAKEDRQARSFRVVMTDDSPKTTYEFRGYVLSVPVSAAVDAVIESNVTVEITGDVEEV